jgi:glycosyltransferase involved in cell wall biosynthesis
MIEVLLDTTYALRRPRSGTGIYIEQLLAALDRRDDVHVTAVANARRRPPAGGGLGSLRNAAADEWWTTVELPRRARAARVELIHHPLPAYAHRARIAQVVTVHDLAFERRPQDFSPAYRRYAHLAHRRAARRAAAVLAVSCATAADMEEVWHVSGPRVHVAPHGPGQLTTPLAPAAAAAARRPGHFLYVGDDEPRKDLPTLLDAYARYRRAGGSRELVLAGAARASASGIRLEREPAAARLTELLQQAAALVHPARHEGFGLTVLEAMATGTPVIAAACPAVVELTAGTATLFEPGDAAALADALHDPPASAAAAAARAGEYSWARSAQIHVAAYSWAVSRS